MIHLWIALRGEFEAVFPRSSPTCCNPLNPTRTHVLWPCALHVVAERSHSVEWLTFSTRPLNTMAGIMFCHTVMQSNRCTPPVAAFVVAAGGKNAAKPQGFTTTQSLKWTRPKRGKDSNKSLTGSSPSPLKYKNAFTYTLITSSGCVSRNYFITTCQLKYVALGLKLSAMTPVFFSQQAASFLIKTVRVPHEPLDHFLKRWEGKPHTFWMRDVQSGYFNHFGAVIMLYAGQEVVNHFPPGL